MSRWLVVFAALQGAMAIALAAVGRHAGGTELVTTASTIQLAHAVAGLVAPLAVAARLGSASGWVLLLGTFLFSVDLYLRGFGIAALGPVAPIGGTAMIAGWLTLAGAAFLRPASPRL